MSATIPIDPDVVTIDHLDPSTPCTIGVVVQLRGMEDRATVGAEPCPNTATWDMVCRNCSATSPVCDTHKATASACANGHCHRCGKVGRPARIFTFYPIGDHA